MLVSINDFLESYIEVETKDEYIIAQLILFYLGFKWSTGSTSLIKQDGCMYLYLTPKKEILHSRTFATLPPYMDYKKLPYKELLKY